MSVSQAVDGNYGNSGSSAMSRQNIIYSRVINGMILLYENRLIFRKGHTPCLYNYTKESDFVHYRILYRFL